MTSPRLVGTHHHYLTNLVGPGTTPGEAIFGLVKDFVNNQGSSLALGDVVKLDTSGADRVVKATTLGDVGVIGVVADVGPFANGDETPVLISGYHAAVKITGAVAAGDYLQASNTDGTAESIAIPAAGTFARATAAGAAGIVKAIIFDRTLAASSVVDFTDLGDVPATYAGAGSKAVAVNAGATGLEFVSFPAAGQTITAALLQHGYDPDLKPTTPGAADDEFDDTTLAAWTQAGSPDTFNGTDLPGFLHVADNDGAEPCGGYKAFTPGAAAFTLAFKVYGNVAAAASNQVYAGVYTSAGAPIVVAGLLNGSAYIVKAAALGGGFTSGTYTYITPNVGPLYVSIQRDATTNYVVKISGDGILWVQVASFSQAGTVDRIYVTTAGFSATVADAFFEFIRTFTTQTTLIGNTPTAVRVIGPRTYDPDLPPAAPSAYDDEFDDDVIGTRWTSVGTPDSLDENTLHGFLHIADNDTTFPCGVYEDFVPGAAAFTVAFKFFSDVTRAGSNQVRIGLYTSAAAEIVGVGSVQGSGWIISAAALGGGGFATGTMYGGPGNLGVFYGAITRDATTNYVVWASQDGITWKPIGTFSQAGTVGRIYVSVYGVAQITEAYVDFVRTFTSQTTKIGNTPDGSALAFLYPPGHPDIRPTMPNAADDEFDDTAGMSGITNGLNSRWAWRNQGGASVTFPPYRMKLNLPASASASHRILEQAVAAGDFAFVPEMRPKRVSDQLRQRRPSRDRPHERRFL
jgi:hypothetical protein